MEPSFDPVLDPVFDTALPDGVQAARDAQAERGYAQCVNVLVARLKRKAQRQGLPLPLLAVRGCGYVFLDEDAPPSYDISR